jgi:hypothetical protein
MKSKKPSYNSFRKKVIKKQGRDSISQSIRHGETLIPTGNEDAQIVLPRAKATHTYEILKTEDMDSNLQFACGRSGFLIGLLFSNEGGTLSIDPIPNDTRVLTLNPLLSDGSWMELLSEGNDWFSWGWIAGEELTKNTSSIFIPIRPNEDDDDGDGLTNEQENTTGTNPTDCDTDDDGSCDGTETGLGTDPTDDTDTPDPNLDSDGDGYTDVEEIEANTDPNDASSYPGATTETVPDPSEIGPVFFGIPNNLVIEAGTLEADARNDALDGVTAVDNIDGDVTVSIVLTFTNYTNIHGEDFTASYSVTDSDGNTNEVEITVSVEDTTAPVITLLGDSLLTVTSGSVGADPGITVTDASTFTTGSTWDSTITDTTATGSYDVVYTAVDVAGNEATPVTRSVVVGESIIPANLIVDDDLFNSSELLEEGSPTLSPSGLVYQLDGTQGLKFNNGFKYDPWAVSGSSPDGVIDNVAGYPDRTVGDLSPARTYSIWFNPDSVPASPSAMALFWKGGPQYGDFTDDGWSIALLNVATASNLRQTIRVSNEGGITQNGGGNYFDSAQYDWDDTGWQHLVVVWGITTSTAKMYLDGIELTSTRTNRDLGTYHTSTGLGGDPTSDSEYHGDSTEGGYEQVLRIGSDPTVGFGFVGKLALPKIYHGELTQEQIEYLFTSGRTALIDDGQTGLPPALP